MENAQALPKLLKARQFHSRIFAALVVLVFIFSQPLLISGSSLREIMHWAGYTLIIIGAFGRVYCSLFIGGRKNTLVMRSGPFSVVRNPLYVFSFLATLGIGLLSGMWVMTALLVGAFITYYPFVVAKEEDFLRAKFGEEYERYLREVPRWLPNMKLWQEAETTESMPKFVRNTIGDAMIFFLALPAYAFITMLQTQQIVPVLLTLP